jgi:cystathionine gamma-synthase
MKSYPIIPPVYLTATYKFDKTDDLIEVVQNRSGFIYSRWDNPTVQESEKVMARLEGFDSALAFSSGMAAISTSLLCFLHRDSRIIYQREIYGGTFELLSELLPRLGVETVAINCENKNLFFEEIKKGVSILYLESPTNPLLRVVDIEPLAAAAHQQGAIVMLDSTFASPVNQQPKILASILCFTAPQNISADTTTLPPVLLAAPKK